VVVPYFDQYFYKTEESAQKIIDSYNENKTGIKLRITKTENDTVLVEVKNKKYNTFFIVEKIRVGSLMSAKIISTDSSFKIRDFKYSDFISYSPIDGPNLFSDLGEQAFIPQPVKEYPLIKYYEIFEKIK
jgi:hypothetical protein